MSQHQGDAGIMPLRFWEFAKKVFVVLAALSTLSWLLSLAGKGYELARSGRLEDIQVPDIPWSIVAVLGFVALLMLTGVLLSGRLGDRALGLEAAHVADQMLAFVGERDRGDLSWDIGSRMSGDSEEERLRQWEEQTNRMISYSTETMAEYTRRFSPQVIWLRNELAKRGVTDQELERFYEHPTNPGAYESSVRT
jgi:hypothetical protein